MRLTSDSATKLSTSVLMTSITPNRSWSQTGSATHSAPAMAAPAQDRRNGERRRKASRQCSPTQVAAIAPA